MATTLFLDQKYINYLAPRLDRFQKKDDDLFNFRCPICGDSEKNKYKARGYFYRKDGRMSMKCHNCHENMSFSNFLKMQDPSLWREYRTEAFIEAGGKRFQDNPDNYFLDTEEPPPEPPRAQKLNLPQISELGANHYARIYVEGRKIPKDQWGRLYYSMVFSLSVGEIFPDYYKIERHKELLRHKEPRLVLPYYDTNKNLIGLNGRSLGSGSAKRYIVAKINDAAPKIYGLDTIDPSQTVYVLEGPIDSLFIHNSVATMDGKLHGIEELRHLTRVLIPDNQSRNSGVLRSIKNAIDAGEAVVIWPSSVIEKDINDMVLGGMTVSEIMNIIEKNTHKGLSAKLAFSNWQKLQ